MNGKDPNVPPIPENETLTSSSGKSVDFILFCKSA